MIVKNKLSSKGNTRRINIRYISMFKYSNQQHVWEAAVTIAKRTRPSCNAKARLLFGSQLRRVGLSQSIQLKQCNLLTCNCVVKDGEKKNILTWLRPKIGYTLFSIDDLSISPYVNIFKWLFGVYTPVSKKSISVAAACGRPGMRLGSIHGIMMPVTSWMLPKIWKVNEDHRC